MCFLPINPNGSLPLCYGDSNAIDVSFISVVDLHSWKYNVLFCCSSCQQKDEFWRPAMYLKWMQGTNVPWHFECYNHVMYFIVILFSCLLLPQSLVWQSFLLESHMLGLKDCKSIKWPFYSCLPCWGNNVPGPRECYHNAGLVFDPVWMAYRYKERNKGNFTLTALTKQFHKTSLRVLTVIILSWCTF